MILFVANYPDTTAERDGMMQRVVAIDQYFAQWARIYLGIRFFGNLRFKRTQQLGNIRIYKVNFFLHFPVILYLGYKARGIYVHSIHNGFRALPYYLFRFKNIFTDMHGVFPEELHYCGKKTAAWLYGIIERITVRYSMALVLVTDAMGRHFREKYGPHRSKIYTIPIFDNFSIDEGNTRRVPGKPALIYAGGTQKWQNVDLMLESLKKVHGGCTVTILTPDLETFSRKLAEYGLTNTVQLLSVPKQEVYEYYCRSDLGFILRDDSIVNRAACPTKLVEYLSCGVIPIVLQSEIGDFAEMGYSYSTIERLADGSLPSGEELDSMRENNYRIVREFKNSARAAMQRMLADFS
jgi:glycosyltransferase involved in cell wall biosynthesis